MSWDQVFDKNDYDGFRQRVRYALCCIFGHKPTPVGNWSYVVRTHHFGPDHYMCARCYDTLPEGNKRRQP